MNTELTNRICHYLKLDTSYAIIINGNYGIGKTFYIKNELFPEVKNIRVPGYEDTQETFKPILVSLFGANSIEDIQNQIFMELHPKLKSKGAKIVSGLGNGVLKYFGSELKEILKDIGTDSFLDYRKILLCIDDIDRKSNDLSLKEVFGFINNLVENLEAKVLLIANEDYLRKEFGENNNYYSLLREKVIGVSVTFKTDSSFIFDGIINSKYKEDSKEYYTFLKENKSLILNRIQQNEDNLRNLIFFLEHFKIIYLSLYNFLQIKQDYSSVKKDIENRILNFTLPLAIEYKKGKLTPEIWSILKENYLRSFISFRNLKKDHEKEQTKEEIYIETYREKYIENNLKTKHFDSIFNYIIGEHFFEPAKLEDEIRGIYNIENNKIPRKEKIFQKLEYWNCLDLSFQEYKSLTSELLKYVDKGEFPLHQYSSIFSYCVRFDNLLKYDTKDLVERFKKGIQKGHKNYEYESSLHMKLAYDSSYPYATEIKEIIDYSLQQNNILKDTIESQKIEKLFSLLKTNPTKFFNELNDYQNGYKFQPVFAYMEFERFWQILQKTKNTFKIDLAHHISRRYQKTIYKELSPDLEFLKKLENRLDHILSDRSIKKLDKVAYKILRESIYNSILNFSPN